MELTAQKIWISLNKKFDDNYLFSSKFSKRKAWSKIYYNLDTASKDTCIVVDYSKRDNRLELDIYFFENREGYDQLYFQKDEICSTEGVELSFEVRTERTQGVYIKRYDIMREVDQNYIDELVEWIQDTALFLCYINERYGLGRDISRPQMANSLRPTSKKNIIQRNYESHITRQQIDRKTLERIEEGVIQGKEINAIVKIRVNQTIFREKLLRRYDSCCLCGVSDARFLVASHIKPWAISESDEKLDVDNGLLLCPDHDLLFDQGFITFDDNGCIKISKELNPKDKLFMNVSENMKIEIHEGNREYLKFHREKVFKK